ncbi:MULTISPECIES: ATP synthase subunit I [unclassified Butyrivibrio]|uniref:ATP synthase subunit I n=1 Tax=unclassified Butyrivibrio TaxID=2639466 RepID=UPI00041C3E71|nr:MULTISPECIES: ATP synthase subunit I [unclassified Butyrivibrio]
MVVQDAVKKETTFIAVGTALASVLVIVLFFVLHQVVPKDAPFGYSVPFDYTIFLGAIGGTVAAVGNFFWMGLTVQKITGMSEEETDRARSTMAVSLRYRTLLQLLWVVLAIFVPAINLVTGVIPLFIPSILIKFRGIFLRGKEGDTKV